MYKPKVYFTASFSGKKQYQKEYDQITNILKGLDIELRGTEIGNYKESLDQNDLDRNASERELHYLAIKKGIKWADLLVFELSHESFQIGHEVTLALESKKHVLGLSKKIDWSERIIHSYFHGKKYNELFLKQIITDFIDQLTNEPLTERFNLFLSKTQLARIKKESEKLNISQSEFIRTLLSKID